MRIVTEVSSAKAANPLELMAVLPAVAPTVAPFVKSITLDGRLNLVLRVSHDGFDRVQYQLGPLDRAIRGAVTFPFAGLCLARS